MNIDLEVKTIGTCCEFMGLKSQFGNDMTGGVKLRSGSTIPGRFLLGLVDILLGN